MAQRHKCARPNLKYVLLSSVSVGTLLAFGMGPAQAQTVPGTFVSIEGGTACGFGDDTGSVRNIPFYSFSIPPATLQIDIGNIRSALEFGSNGCGWSGRIGVGSTRSSLFGLGDSWGVFVRHTDINGDDETARATGDLDISLSYPGAAYTISFPDFFQGTMTGERDTKRTVVDFEVGQDIGIGSGSKTRIFGGIRYARFKSETRLAGSFDLYYGLYPGAPSTTTTLTSKSEFNGVGPRLGFQTRFPVLQGVSLTLGASGSILWGRREIETSSSVLAFGGGSPLGLTSFSEEENDTTWVGNIEGEAAFSVLPFGSNGGQLDIGVRAEGWFREGRDYTQTYGGETTDNHNWGPFGRFTVNLN